MSVEGATFLSQLNNAWPLGTDFKNEGDNHVRLIKAVLQATFPNIGQRFGSVITPAKSADYGLATTDNFTIHTLSGARTVTSAAAASIGSGHWQVLITDTNDSIFDPNGAEQVNGAGNYTLPKNTITFLFCDGTQWFAYSMLKTLSANMWTFLAAANFAAMFTLIVPADVAYIDVTQQWSKTQRPTKNALTTAVAWDATNNQQVQATVNGSTFTVANPTNPLDGAYYSLYVIYTTSNLLAFDTKYKGIASYIPTATAGKRDHLVFRYNSTDDQMQCVGYTNDIGT